MTNSDSKKYILGLFKHTQELRSYMQDYTDNGVFTKSDLDAFDEETLEAVKDDLEQQQQQEAYF